MGEDFGGSHGFQSKGISRKSIKRGGGLRKLTAYRLLMKGRGKEPYNQADGFLNYQVRDELLNTYFVDLRAVPCHETFI